VNKLPTVASDDPEPMTPHPFRSSMHRSGLGQGFCLVCERNRLDPIHDVRLDEQETSDGIHVFFHGTPYRVDDISAELPDGTRVPAVLQQGGRRIGLRWRAPPGDMDSASRPSDLGRSASSASVSYQGIVNPR
jgi:hypothetical protein